MRRLVVIGVLIGCNPSPAKQPPAKQSAAAQPAPEQPAVAASVTPIRDRDCEDVKFPSAGGSVLVIPGPTMTRALAPVVRAACACTRSGDQVRISAVLVPEAGTVTANVHDDDAVDTCIRGEIDGRFEPFEVGTDCIDCGPKRYSKGPPEPPRSRVTYPFTFVHP